LEATVGVDVIDDHRAARSQSCPRAVGLETNLSLAVQAVVNEELDLAKLSIRPV
jgi:hypothetical protein